MKIRNPKLIRSAAWLGANVAVGLFRTLRFQHQPLGPEMILNRVTHPDRFLYSIWHENLMLPTIAYGGPDIAVLISAHADGQLLGGLIQRMGMGMVLGSTTRGGADAVRQLVRPDTPWRNVAITPDGPRGPRRIVQPGAIYVASRTGMKIVPIGVGYNRPWRFKSWDRFAVPKPCSRAKCVTGEPILVPPKLRAEQLEPYRLIVQAEMDRLSGIAENWATTNRLVVPAHSPFPLRLAS